MHDHYDTILCSRVFDSNKEAEKRDHTGRYETANIDKESSTKKQSTQCRHL